MFFLPPHYKLIVHVDMHYFIPENKSMYYITYFIKNYIHIF